MDCSVGVVISYCTNDARFLSKCIEEALVFSQAVVVVVADHFFDGTAENRDLLNQAYSSHPEVLFVEVEYLADQLYSLYHSVPPGDSDWSIYWAATTRYIGFHYLPPECTWAFFLDSDEIIDGRAFRFWLDQETPPSACRFGSYLYALRPTLRAKKLVNLPLLVEKKQFSALTLINPLERIGAYLAHRGPKQEGFLGVDGKPMVHHYSWVRTKEECLQKARTWGHRSEADWPRVIEETFQGTSPYLFDLSWHDFEEIQIPFFDPFFQKNPIAKKGSPNVLYLNRPSFLKKTIEKSLLEDCNCDQLLQQ